MAFIRSTSVNKPWLCAVNDRYKLVYSEMGDPWLFDLEKDPVELINLVNDPESKNITTTMIDQLQRHCKLQKDPFGDLPEIKSAITAALGN